MCSPLGGSIYLYIQWGTGTEDVQEENNLYFYFWVQFLDGKLYISHLSGLFESQSQRRHNCLQLKTNNNKNTQFEVLDFYRLKRILSGNQ